MHFTAKNGTLVLKGSVKTAAQCAEAARLAKSVPNVKEVVNKLKAEPDQFGADSCVPHQWDHHDRWGASLPRLP